MVSRLKAHYETIDGVQTSIEKLGYAEVVLVFYGSESDFCSTFKEGEEWIKKHVESNRLLNNSNSF